MHTPKIPLKTARVGAACGGFRLMKKENVPSKNAVLYTLLHEKTRAELLYLDRPAENKTFAIAFRTLPEDSSGVFHILEHSVLNGSRKYPVKEPFVSLLQSSMQTFLNAMTYGDKTVYPVSSRNEPDFRNLMSVYLDAVFFPLIYERKDIFLQEGRHIEFDEDGTAHYNGVVFSEMKGAYAEVDRVLEEYAERMLFPDTCYGFSSGGLPECIPDLTYEQFIATHRRFYHPSNARIFLDGIMDIDDVLGFIDREYLSKFDYRAPDFGFIPQTPKPVERTMSYAAQEGSDALAHMAISKILCSHEDTETIYAAHVLADYLTGSNEAPLKRAFLERGLAQDVGLSIGDGVFQPTLSLLIRNTAPENFDELRRFVPQTIDTLLAEGLDREALSAALERFAFSDREISEPYGIELALNAMDAWLYGGDPLTHIENSAIFESLRNKLDGDYFPALLRSMLANPDDKSYLHLLPSLTKAQEDADRENARLAALSASWSAEERMRIAEETEQMRRRQQEPDRAEALATLPHLSLRDISPDVAPLQTQVSEHAGITLLRAETDTNGIVYLHLYFDISDFTTEQLRLTSVLCSCFGELRTEHHAADVLQTKLKALFGELSAKIDLVSEHDDLQSCTPYLHVSASVLAEKLPAATELLTELLRCGRYDEISRIHETIRQSDYYLKQALIGNGHSYAIIKALAPFSAAGTLHELLGGESNLKWFSAFAEGFSDNAESHTRDLQALADRAFARNRVFVGYCGTTCQSAIERLLDALPDRPLGARPDFPTLARGNCAIEISGGVGFSALGHNLYALGGSYNGACAVLSSLMTYTHLWNAVRVQGGAYGTGMSVRRSGDIFCYSYRDPDLQGSRAAFAAVADYLETALNEGVSLDDLIIGTVNTTDPLLSPAGICTIACLRYLRQTPPDEPARLRREILNTDADALRPLIRLLRGFAAEGCYCAVADHASVAFVKST